jgi:hypothetical protein
MKLVKTYIVLFAFVGLAGCSDEYVEARRTVSLTPFTSVDIHSVFSVYLVQDSFYGVDIVADDDIINNIDVRVQGDILSLVDNRKVKWTTPESNKVKVYVHAPDHGTINAYATYSLYSVGAITSNLEIIHQPNVRFSEIDLNLDNGSFYYWNNYMCAGKLTLRGQCESFDINNYALHQVNASELRAQSGLISTYAKADCRVNVAGRLKYSLHGQGNIYVYGNPDELIMQEHTSSGKLIRVD